MAAQPFWGYSPCLLRLLPMHSRRPRPRPRAAGTRARSRHAKPKQWLPVRLLARVLIGVLVPLLGITWLVGSHEVMLQVDGEPHALTTYARTVDELLDRADVPYSENDQVVPAPDTQLRDGMVVEVVHAREITLLIGGKSKTVLVTALSVDDVVDQLAKRQGLTGRSIIRPSRLTAVTSGMTIEVLNPVAVTVVADGKTSEVVTDSPTVDGVLDGLGLTLGPDDRVTPAGDADVEAGMRIVVERIDIKRETRDLAVPYDTEERSTDELDAGESRELQPGRDGVEEVTELVTVVDGVERSREVISRTTITAAQTRIVEVGTGTSAPARPAPAASSDSQDSASPPASEPEPEPEPEPEQTSSSNEQTGQASYYHHPEEGMTAAHRTLPFGTVVTVTNLANGQSVNVTINDRGPYIDGRIIDLNDTAFERIASYDSGVIDVRITW